MRHNFRPEIQNNTAFKREAIQLPVILMIEIFSNRAMRSDQIGKIMRNFFSKKPHELNLVVAICKPIN